MKKSIKTICFIFSFAALAIVAAGIGKHIIAPFPLHKEIVAEQCTETAIAGGRCLTGPIPAAGTCPTTTPCVA